MLEEQQRIEVLEAKLNALEQAAMGKGDELASAIATLNQTLDRFSKQLRRQERLNIAQATEIGKLRKITLGVVMVVAVFWFAGDRTLNEGAEIGEIVQLVGIIAGGGVATAAISQPTPAQQQPAFEDDTEEEGDRH